MMNTVFLVIASLFFAACLHITFFSWVQLHLLYLSCRKKSRFLVPSFRASAAPRVTVQLPVYNEKYVVQELINQVCALDYPTDRLEIQILDDSTDETTAIIADTIAQYRNSSLRIAHIRRQHRVGYKAGALQHGLQTAQGELIVIFDADFRPEPDFLLKTVPHFQNKQIGAVQTRWGYLNEDYSVLTKLQAILLNHHFIVEQPGRYAGGFTLQFNGTAGLWRKQTILDAGGWHSDTLLEDVDLSYRAQLRGWNILFREDVVCPAEIPPDLKSLKVQQFRWMQGQAEVARKHLASIWKSDFGWLKKFHATAHLTSCFVFISILLTALLSVPMIYIVPNLGISTTWLALVSMGFLFNGIVFFWANYSVGWPHLSKIKRVTRFAAIFPLLLLYSMGLSFHNTVAILKGCLGMKTPFYRTPKYNLDVSTTESKSAYNTQPVSFMATVERGLTLYFLLGVGIAFYMGNFTFLSYNLVSIIAYLLVSVQSIEKLRPSIKKTSG